MYKPIFLLLITSVCFAEYKSEPCSDCNPCNTCNTCTMEKPTPCNPTIPGYNTSYKRGVACPWNVFLSTSYLYWDVTEDGLDLYTQYNLESILPNGMTTNTSETFLEKEMDTSYKSAFRVKAGIDFHSDNWQFFANYLWFHNSYHDNFTFDFVQGVGASSSESYLFPNFALKSSNHIGRITTPTTLSSKWDLDLDIIDAALSRKYYVGTCLIFDTHFGLRGSIIDQKMDQTFNIQFSTDQVNPDFTDSTLIDANALQKIDSWGVGPIAGIRTTWMLLDGLDIFGTLSASLLYTSYILDASQTGLLTGPLDSSNITSLNQNITINTLDLSSLRPYLDLGIGFTLGTLFCDSLIYFELDIAYDFMAMWHQNMFRRLTPFSADSEQTDRFVILHEDLFLHGVSITARFTF